MGLMITMNGVYFVKSLFGETWEIQSVETEPTTCHGVRVLITLLDNGLYGATFWVSISCNKCFY